jgi:hypothetical protein
MKMTDLSPAAQAVLDAITEISPAPADEIAAAALRAAALYCTRERRILMTIADELDGATTTSENV